MEDMFKQMDKVIPGSNVANETESNEEKPELGMLIVIIQYVLIALLFILEKCIGALRDMQRFVQLTAKRINKRLNKMMEREEYFQKLEDRVD